MTVFDIASTRLLFHVINNAINALFTNFSEVKNCVCLIIEIFITSCMNLFGQCTTNIYEICIKFSRKLVKISDNPSIPDKLYGKPLLFICCKVSLIGVRVFITSFLIKVKCSLIVQKFWPFLCYCAICICNA